MYSRAHGLQEPASQNTRPCIGTQGHDHSKLSCASILPHFSHRFSLRCSYPGADRVVRCTEAILCICSRQRCLCNKSVCPAAILALTESFDTLTSLVNVGYLFGALMVGSSVLLRRYMPKGPGSKKGPVLLRFWAVIAFAIAFAACYQKNVSWIALLVLAVAWAASGLSFYMLPQVSPHHAMPIAQHASTSSS